MSDGSREERALEDPPQRKQPNCAADTPDDVDVALFEHREAKERVGHRDDGELAKFDADVEGEERRQERVVG